MEENTKTNIEEQNFRVNIKQTSKGFHYFETTVRADNEADMGLRLTQAVELAKSKCDLLNKQLGE